jgi:hypothetical protein
MAEETDPLRVVAVEPEGRLWRVWFNKPVILRGMDAHLEVEEKPHPDARHYWYAETVASAVPVAVYNDYTGDALGAYMWGLQLIAAQEEQADAGR